MDNMQLPADESLLVDSQGSEVEFERIATVLLAVAAVLLVVSLTTTWAWRRAVGAPIDIDRLTDAQRQILVEDLVQISPGIHQWTYYEPRIGYTLVPNIELSVWNDTFRTNEMGFRAPPAAKSEDTFRVLFVGDSWTFGMGIARDESFPLVFERLAREAGVQDFLGKQRIEAWTLALPGWSGVSQVAAFDYFADFLRPDAVVWVPSSNDADTTPLVLPNGSLASFTLAPEPAGSSHAVSYRGGPFLSHEYVRRWREFFLQVAGVERRLSRQSIPLFVYFVACWEDTIAHHWILESGIRSPYAVVPMKFTMGTWENPKPIGHGTPAANEIYGAALYRLVATHLGWPEHEVSPEDEDYVGRIHTFDRAPVGGGARFDRLARRTNRTQLAESYSFPLDKEAPKVGAFDAQTAAMFRATTLLVRRHARAKTLKLELACLPEAPLLYPLGLTLRIPAAGGGTAARIEILKEPCHQTASVAIPESIPAGAAMDLVLEADRAADVGNFRSGRSYRLLSVHQE